MFEVAPAGVAGASIDHVSPDSEVEWMCRLATETGVPVTFLMLQTDDAPDDWRKHLELITRGPRPAATASPPRSPAGRSAC